MNPFKALTAPRLPSAAIGLSGEGAGVVSLDRRDNVFVVKRAVYVSLAEGLVRPNFDESNVASTGDLANVLAELVAGVGMLKRKRWSVALPEAATRTSILTLETSPGTRAETEEMLRWKMERAMAAPLDELRVTRDRLRADAQGRVRYLVTAVRLAVLAEYETVFESLGWHAGLILPRHMGEAWWLMNDAPARTAASSDSMLVSAHAEGFTVVVLRGGQPLLVRNVNCDPEDRADELYRFLLFYRDRNAPSGGLPEEAVRVPTEIIESLFVAGSGLDYEQAQAAVEETLAIAPRRLDAADVHLSLPTPDLDFRHLAAPAGLAALAWG